MALAVSPPLPRLRELGRHDSAAWRRVLHAGLLYTPRIWVRHSPTLFGLGFALGLRQQREVVRKTLEMVLGPRPRWRELREVGEVFVEFAHSMTDAILAGSRPGYRVQGEAVGEWHFRDALAQEKGLVVATAHTAGWDLGGAILRGVQDREILVVMAPEEDRQAGELHDQNRQREGVRIVHVGPDPLASLPLLHHLRQARGVVAMQFDRTFPAMRTRTASLFGRPWPVAEGPLSLSALTGAPIVPVFTRRLGFMRYQCIIMAPFVVPAKPSASDLDEAAARLAAALERFVRAYPTSWFRFSE
jgi:KDO2-lipid IV(A) lauroyltransferase